MDPKTLVDQCLFFLERHFDDISENAFQILPTYLLNTVLGFMLERRRLGSRVLNDINIEKLISHPHLTELELVSYWMGEKPIAKLVSSHMTVLNLKNCKNLGIRFR